MVPTSSVVHRLGPLLLCGHTETCFRPRIPTTSEAGVAPSPGSPPGLLSGHGSALQSLRGSRQWAGGTVVRDTVSELPHSRELTL